MKHEITSISFAGGLNVKADPKSVKDGQMTIADNVIYQTAGIVRKREGHDYLGRGVASGFTNKIISVESTTLDIVSGNAIANVNGEVCYADNRYFYTYSDTNDTWTRRGDLSEAALTKDPALTGSRNQTYSTTNLTNTIYADIDDVRCVVYNSSAPILTRSEYLAVLAAGTTYSTIQTGAYVGFWDKLKDEWIMPPFRLWDSLRPANQFLMPVVVAHDRTFRINTICLGYNGVTPTQASPGIVCVDSDAVAAGTFQYQSIASTVTILGITMPVDVWGPRDNAVIGEYGLFLDQTHALDAAVGGNFSYLLISGPSNPSTGASGGKLATVGTTGPAVVLSAAFNSPTSVTPVWVATTVHTARTAVTANSAVAMFTGQVGPDAGISFSPASTTWLSNFYTDSNFRRVTTGGTYYLGGLTEDDLTRAIVISKQDSNITPTQNYSISEFSISGMTITGSLRSSLYPWPGRYDLIDPISKPVWQTELGFTSQPGWYAWVRTVGPFNQLQPTNSLIDLTQEKVRAIAQQDTAQQAVDLLPDRIPNLTFMSTQPTSLGATLPTDSVAATYEVLGRGVDPASEGGIFAKGERRIIPLDVGAFITGARPSYYDGVVVRELGFNSFPEFSVATTFPTVAIGGNLGHTPVQDIYYYTGIHRYFDNAGKLVMSASFPTVLVATTLLGTSTQYIQFYMNRKNEYQSDVPGTFYKPIFYRTTADDALNFRELSIFSTSPSIPGSGGVEVYVDNTPDSDLRNTGLPFLYSSPIGGELDNFPPPACSIAIASQQRIFVVSDENPNRVYYTKPFAPTRAPEFTSFYIEVDPNSGPITGLGVVDANLIVFKEKVIYVVTGSGPDATGNGTFNDPSVLWSDDGCINSRSVLVTAQGIFYQSTRGIQLLNRSLTNEYVGALVEPYTAGNLVTSALIVPKKSQVRFFMDDGIVLVYDYLLQVWSRFTSETPFAVNSSTLWYDEPLFLEQNRGMIIYSSPLSCVDVAWDVDPGDGSPQYETYPMTLETGWIKFAGLHTWNRLRRVAVLGDYKTENTAQLSFAYDYTPTYLNSVSFSTGTLLTSPQAYQWRARAPRQVMSAVRFKLTDSPVVTVTGGLNNGESYNLAGLTLEWATKGGITRMPDNKSK